jgi:DNA-binding MarR family transcriptional regulator
MPKTPSITTDVAEFAGQLFFRLWRASHTRIAVELESIGLTPASFGLLNLIGSRDGGIQQQLGAAMGVDPSTMVALIDDLEGRGLAKRRPHPKDRRAREVFITPKGRQVLEQGRGLALQVEDDVLGGLTAAERRNLLELLRRAVETAPPQSLWRSEEGD